MKKIEFFYECDFHYLKKTFKIMRITVFLLIATILQTFANDTYSQSTRLSLDFSNTKLVDVMDQIEELSEFYFLFNEKLIETDREVSMSVNNQRIDKILDNLFSGTDVVYTITDRKIILAPEFLSGNQQQQKTITGKVTDEERFPLPGVTVFLKGTTIGTTTNADGEYTLEVPADAEVMSFSFVGMETKEISIAGQTVINVALASTSIGIDEVVAIGYGSVRKRDLTGSVSVVDPGHIENISGASLTQGLVGTTAGLNVEQSGFRPGGSPSLSVRGDLSFSLSSSPLIILDGIPYSENLNSINTADIKSMVVLKDASSVAIYGARGANGVILIETKTGKSGKPRVSYNASFGIQTINQRLDMLDGPQHIQYLKDWNDYLGNDTSDPRSLLFANSLPNYDAGIEVDWEDIAYQTAMQQKHTISISGANEATNYYTSIGIYDQDGIVKGSGFKRYSVQSNISHTFNDWITLKANVSLSQTDAGGASASTGAVHRMSPYGKAWEDNGDVVFHPQYPQVYHSHPLANIDATIDNITRRARGIFVLELKPKFIPGLTYKANFGTTLASHKLAQYYPVTTLSGSTNQGYASIENKQRTRSTFENIVTYNKEIDKHHINFTGVFSSETSREEKNKMSANKFLDDASLYHFIESTINSDGRSMSSGLEETAWISQVGRLSYDYAKKYFLTASVRRDGSSVFGKNNRYGTFPSAAIGWTISNEDFMANSTLFDFLKLRVSYGSVGNTLPPYFTQDEMNLYEMVFGDSPSTVKGLRIGTIGNPDLQWETTTTANVGVDFAMLNNRLSGTVEVYKSNGSDLLMQRTVPITNGYNNIWYNIGETENNGIDITLKSRNIKSGDFSWDTDFTFSLVRDKIVSLYGGTEDDIANKWFIGEPLQVYYDRKVIGIWQTDDDIANSAQPDAQPGFPIFEDVGDDKVMDADDMQIIDSKLPDWTAGLTNTFSYKDFDLTVVAYAVWGINKPNGLLDPGKYDIAKNTNYIDIPYWTPTRPSNKYPTPAYDLVRNVKHDFFQNSSFVRIKDIILSYNFPNSTLDRIGIQGLRVYLQGSNLYTFTDWIGNDPENGSAYSFYPSARTFQLGLNLQF